MLFPFGTSCKVREAIERYNCCKIETNIFDWLITNFEAILYCIENIDKPFTADDFYDAKYVWSSHKTIFHKQIKFDSIHDCDLNNSFENEMPMFLAKYNRRLNRLKNYILSNTKLDFIHLIDFIHYPTFQSSRCHHSTKTGELYIPTSQQLHDFHNAIKKINPNCNYRIHILLPPTYCKQYKCNCTYDENELNLLANEHTFIHYLEQDENKESFAQQCRHWSWDTVFRYIENKT